MTTGVLPSPAYADAAPTAAAGDDRDGRAARALVWLAWAAVVLPRLVQTMTTSKFRSTIGATAASSGLATLSERLLDVALLALCAVLVLQRVRRLPTDRRAALLVLLAPWAYTVVREVYAGRLPHALVDLLYPALVVTAWVVRPPLRALATLGWATGATAVLCMLLGGLMPDRGLYRAATGGFVAPPKELLPIGILIGPFTDGNNLGQVLAIGAPSIALVRVRGARIALGLLTIVAVLWTSSRSSLGALLVVAVLALVLRAVTPRGRPALARVLLLALGATVVALPFLTRNDAAFTNRGHIWRVSLAAWSQRRPFGFGLQWYDNAGRYANSLGGFAFHGHNEVVQTLVTGGLLGLALVVALAVVVAGRALGYARVGVHAPVLFLAALFVSSCLEVSFGVLDRDFLLAVTVLPVTFTVFGADRP